LFQHPVLGITKFQDIPCDSVLIISSTKEIENGNSLIVEISPNPFTEYLEISFNQNISNSVVQIYDLSGRLVHSQKIEKESNRFKISTSPNLESYF